MQTLDHPTGLQNGERVRFIGKCDRIAWLIPGDIVTIRSPNTEESEFKSLDYHHTFTNGHEYVWCIRSNKSQFLARREDLEAL